MYYFYPHGQKKITNLKIMDGPPLSSYEETMKRVSLIMHDQEPLHYSLHHDCEKDEIVEFLEKNFTHYFEIIKNHNLAPVLIERCQNLGLSSINIYRINDRYLLCHSEKNSKELQKYENQGAIGVYYWNHVLLAKDWYRFALYDQRLTITNFDFCFDWNIYCRAWTGTREYRLKFLEMLSERQLQKHSRISFCVTDQDHNYRDHKFSNQDFCISQPLDSLSSHKEIPPSMSADYSPDDYQNCAVDVVLETLFDDDRIYLTEKILRPIACGKPFILVSSAESLCYLRDYGFQTFGDLIDESYDTIENPVDRLKSIIETMKNISSLAPDQKRRLFEKLHHRASINQKRFWSDDFSNAVVNEFKENFKTSMAECLREQKGRNWISTRMLMSRSSESYKKLMTSDHLTRSKQDLISMLKYVNRMRST